MTHSQMCLIYEIVISVVYSCYGSKADKVLVVGLWDPASVTIITEIPKYSTSSFNNVTVTQKPSSFKITSLASDPKNAVVFASIKDSIYIYHNISNWQTITEKIKLQFEGKSEGFGQIAFDFLSSNLYWCDSLLNWIAMKAAYNFNNTIYKVIVYKDLNQPEGLALDPEDRLMFFSDNNPVSRIEKASLDGSHRVVIVHRGLSRVRSLTLDTANNKLYWADYGRYTLGGCEYDGSNRRVIRHRNFVSVNDLVYHQNILHAVSSGYKAIFAVDVTSGSLLYYRTLQPAQPVAIAVYDSESIGTIENPCSTLNCHHICVNTQLGPNCLCSEGFDLDSNGVTCTRRSWFYKRGFVASNASVFVMYDIHSATGASNAHHYIQLPSDDIEAFAVDAMANLIYFLDNKSSNLTKYDIISRKTSILTSLSSATDLTFDWFANLLGWIEKKQSSIRSFSVYSQTTVTIYSCLKHPASLTVDSSNGKLYWISGTSGKSIIRGSWAREPPKILITTANLNDPNSLQYDVSSNRLYWLDRTVIKSATTNGLDIKSHLITNGATKAFAYKGFFCWIDGDTIKFARKTSSSAEHEIGTVQNVKDIAVFDSFLQQDRQGSCQILNGGCGEICVPEQYGRRCECDVGLTLQPDQNCDSDVRMVNFIVVTDYTHGRIVQIDLQSGTLSKLPLSLDKVVGIAFDESTRTLFYSEVSTYTISSTTLHGKNTTLVYATGYEFTECMAIDFSTGNLYYTARGPNSTTCYVGVIHRTTSLHKTLIKNIDSIKNIVLHPSKGLLFWTEMGNLPKVSRANMDGTNIRDIATKNVGKPKGLAIDFTSSRLYWTDWLNHRIETSDLNGGNRSVLATDFDAYLADIVVHGQYLYYTAWNRKRVTKMDKTTGLKIKFMPDYPELGRLDTMDIYADEKRDISESCLSRNGLCSTFCFPTSTGRTCGCQDNVDLQPDQLTCQGVFRCPTLLPKLNFIDCLPYSGRLCVFECNAGYRYTSTNTAFCDFTGKWSPTTDTLCKEASKTYVYVGTSVAVVVVALLVMVGVFLKKRRDNAALHEISYQCSVTDTQSYEYDGVDHSVYEEFI